MGAIGTNLAEDAKLNETRIAFRVAFLTALAKADESQLLELALVDNSNSRSTKYKFLGDMPGFTEWIGDRRISGTRVDEILVEAKKWANGFSVQRDDLKDDNIGIYSGAISDLVTKAQWHRFDLISKLILNGFTGVAYPEVGTGLAYDGKFFFDTTHVFGSNKLTVALTSAALDTVDQMFGELTTIDTKDPLNVAGTHLFVGPKNYANANTLINTQYLANGGTNPYFGRYKIVKCPRFKGTYDDYWAVGDLSKALKPFILKMLEEITLASVTGQDTTVGFMRDEEWFGAQGRYNVGYYAPQLMIGSAL